MVVVALRFFFVAALRKQFARYQEYAQNRERAHERGDPAQRPRLSAEERE